MDTKLDRKLRRKLGEIHAIMDRVMSQPMFKSVPTDFAPVPLGSITAYRLEELPQTNRNACPPAFSKQASDAIYSLLPFRLE